MDPKKIITPKEEGAEVSLTPRPPKVTPPPLKDIDIDKGKTTKISYTIVLNRGQLYKCFRAFENIFEKSDVIKLKVIVELKEGVDSIWLRNAFEEPIEETGAIIEKEE
ncbi:MAG: hypothetical protein ABDH49_06850 [Candidatus Hydrothermales bacterium]